MSDARVPRSDHLPAEVVDRVRLTVAATDCDDLPKVDDAGQVRNHDGVGVQVMHNGVLVEAGGYFGDWMSEIIRCLRGHHEPQEEAVFARVLERLRGGSAPTVVELGAFWAYYSLWALHEFPDARVVALEPDPANLELGRRNARLNGRTLTFVHGVMGRHPGEEELFENLDGTSAPVRQYGLRELFDEAGVERCDLLLCDIQGGEQFVFGQAAELLRAGRVRFAVVSTHHHSISGDPLTHQRVLAELQELGGHVVAEHTVGESCSGDGLVVVSFDPSDCDLVVHTSRVRQGDSLFGPLEADLADEQRRARELAGRVAEAEAESAALSCSLAAEREQRRVVEARLHQLQAARLYRWTEPARGAYARARSRGAASPPPTPAAPAAPVAPAPPASPPTPAERPVSPLAATSPRPGRPQLLFGTDDSVIGRELSEGGSFDAAQTERALNVVRRLGRTGTTFVDVGANIGTSTVAALWDHGFAQALCMEPDVTNVRLLRCNLALNGLEGRAVVRQVALSAQAGELLLEQAPDNRGDHRLRLPGPVEDGLYGEAARPVEPVAVVTLDDALHEAGLQTDDVGVVWVDNQGHEAHVLRGGAATIAAGVPFVVELWPYGLRRAGGLELFQETVRRDFGAFVDVRSERSEPQSTDRLEDVVRGLEGLAHTDLVLLPR
ncbi:MAG: FkbM family methyltransferase [Frankiales bacterium]|nr:FkbM family methyltransferase [Frankiales bacterium]